MRVETIGFVYTLYVGVPAGPQDFVWVMHVFTVDSQGVERWLDSVLDVSKSDPFKSVVKYDAWS